MPTPRDCTDIYEHGNRSSGVHAISPDNISPTAVYCELTDTPTDGSETRCLKEYMLSCSTEKGHTLSHFGPRICSRPMSVLYYIVDIHEKFEFKR